MEQNFITSVIQLSNVNREKIENELNELDNPAGSHIRKALQNDKIIHFMSASLIHGDEDVDFLAIEMSVDGPVKSALALFDDQNTLSPIFAPLFKAFDHSGPKAPFLYACLVKTGASYFRSPGLNFSGVPGMRVQRIEDDFKVARGVRKFFDDKQPSGSALEIFEQLKSGIESDPIFTAKLGSNPPLRNLLVHEDAPILDVKKRSAKSPIVIAQIALAIILKLMWPMLILAVAATYFTLPIFETTLSHSWAITWRFFIWTFAFILLSTIIFGIALYIRERKEEGDLSLPNPKTLADARSREDIGQVQNHLFGVSKVKPGLLRKISLRLTFLLIGQLAKRSFRPGYLNEIGTINFARWYQIPGTDKLIFCSNYGGSWESYLEDFITKATAGLTGVWSNTLGFPKSRLLFFKGAKSGEAFKRWARRQQIPTRFWYSAYPHLTTERIRINAAIRLGILKAKTASEAEAFLNLFGSAARPSSDVERDEIQSLVFKGLGSHAQSACILLQFPTATEDTKAWLRSQINKVGFGIATVEERIDQIAISASGLKKLGLDEATLSQFSYPFLQGMDHPERSRVLADTGEDKPELWLWGHHGAKGDLTVDCAYTIYIQNQGQSLAVMKKKLKDYCSDLDEEIENLGGSVVDCIITEHFQDRKRTDLKTANSPLGNAGLPREPFGFVDGISQPIIKGLQRGMPSTESSQHHVEPGEFILGYPDNRGTHSLAATVDAKNDPNNILPDHRASDGGLGEGKKDFSRNGSYLVIRHLDQDVKGFDNFLERSAKTLKDHKGIPKGYTHKQTKEFLAAKMVGRWKDGTSLVKFPFQPGTGWDGKTPNRPPDNDFLLGREDPVGLSCPFGSHVRRANPRDSFTPHDDEQLEIVNRHRILRRGRFYSNQKTNEKGLLFMCFNADIERQFEFIQQTWCQARQFMGLDNEVDPILGRGGKMGRITIPTEQGPIFLKGTPDAVTVVGGGYFFAPSKSSLQYLSL